MFASQSDPQGTGRAPQPSTSEAPLHVEQTADRVLLERVLQRTTAVCSGEEPLDAADREALREVARRHQGRPLVLDPVVVELVQAVLNVEFRVQSALHLVWQPVSLEIAQTLLDDPVSRNRLEAFWGRLSGEVS